MRAYGKFWGDRKLNQQAKRETGRTFKSIPLLRPVGLSPRFFHRGYGLASFLVFFLNACIKGKIYLYDSGIGTLILSQWVAVRWVGFGLGRRGTSRLYQKQPHRDRES